MDPDQLTSNLSGSTAALPTKKAPRTHTQPIEPRAKRKRNLPPLNAETRLAQTAARKLHNQKDALAVDEYFIKFIDLCQALATLCNRSLYWAMSQMGQIGLSRSGKRRRRNPWNAWLVIKCRMINARKSSISSSSLNF